MIRSIMSGLIFLTWIGVGNATSVSVRSGEHENFTRLVIKIPQDTPWRIAKSARSAELFLDLKDLEFETSEVFDRIPKNRLQSLEQAAPGLPLVLAFNCHCQLSAFVQSDSLLVIDISDEESGLSDQTSLESQDLNPYRFSLPATAVDQFQGPSQIKWSSQVSLPAISLSEQVWENRNVIDLTKLPAAPNTVPTNLSEYRLVEQIERASGQGLLELRADLPSSQGARMPPAESSAAQVKVGTSADREASKLSSPNPIDHLQVDLDSDSDSSSCLEDTQLNIGDWADSRPFGVQLGERRRSLFGEFDTLSQENVIGLAKFYLHFGFGAEAIRSLKMLEDEDMSLLMALAEFIDTRSISGANPFRDQTHCKSDAALWSFMTEKNPGSVSIKMSKNSVILAFSGLPPHLRHLLGAELSRRFLALGDTSSAEKVLRSIDRREHAPTPATKMAQAVLDSKSGNANAAKFKLENVIAASAEQSPTALILLIDEQYAANDTVSEKVSDLAAAYAMEYRNSELGAELQRVHILALAMGGQFEQAHKILLESKDAMTRTSQNSLRFAIMNLLTTLSDDVTFLSLGFEHLDQSGIDLPVHLGNAMAQRFLDLGFPAAALKALEKPAAALMQSSRRLLKAEIALEQNLPHRALVELSGLNEEAATLLRARALQEAGEFNQAARAFRLVSEHSNEARALWLSGNWGQSGLAEPGIHQAASEIAENLNLDEPLVDAEGPLSQAAELLSVSATARAQIAELLKTITSPAVGMAN